MITVQTIGYLKNAVQRDLTYSINDDMTMNGDGRLWLKIMGWALDHTG